MDNTAVEAIEKIIGRSVHFEADGMTFARNEDGEIKRVLWEPEPDTVALHTITGLVDFIKANIDGLDYKEYFINVKSPTEVKLLSALCGEKFQRDLIAAVDVDSGMNEYRFGKYQFVEEFIISLNSLFEETNDREKLVNFVSRVHGGESFTLDDDGVTQIANVTRGVSGAITEKESAPKIVNLKPFRTFRDIDQPESTFLFRMKLLEGNVVGVCLYEADGGRWRNTAVKSIQKFLEENLKDTGVTVIA